MTSNMGLQAGLQVNLPLLSTLLLLAMVPVLESHNHHRGYSNKAKYLNVTSPDISSNEVSKNQVLNDELPEFVDDLLPKSQDTEDDDSNSIPTQDAVNEEILLLLRSMTTEMEGLRNQVSNLKLQNHLVYKTLRRMQSKCAPPAAPLIQAAALKMEPPPKPTCPRDYIWNRDLQSCYRFGTDRITWRMAREKCRAQGADLVDVTSSREQRFIMDKARKSPDTRHCDFWTGLTDKEKEGDWRWISTNKPLTYSHWNYNEPNNGNGNEHCMHMLWVFNWAWNDSHCNQDNGCYICEIHYD